MVKSQLNIRISAEAKQKLKAHAATTGRSLKDLIAEGISLVCRKYRIKTTP